ncbi:MAG: fructose-specific PTS transporter subunit EIIC [Finegoldia magna]|uniref:PTS fructose transporter subunit IIABC n=1 Tax=Finegoldia magna TaxID=1260 RepID=UPI00290D39AE|nr:fructose-specific PTS transporter subunit EIIC [Finegoldia magna]MDU7032967.1 fructose-specific PTS transporter subunit EIIC [Finegoldia magna]
MEIKDLLSKDLMIMNLKSTTKKDVIDEMIEKLYEKNVINDVLKFRSEIMKRELESSTGLGEGVAMPHAKTSAVNKPAIVFARSTTGVDYEALDGEDTYIFFMIAATEGQNQMHIETLAKLSKLLLKEGFIDRLKASETPEDVYKTIDDYAEESEPKVAPVETSSIYTEKQFILAVTACPTGIAHTYMAEEALKEQASKMGVDIKVETNGSDGVKNKLTADDIEKATGIIIAADRKVETARFNGKNVIECPVSDAIRNPKDLIQKIVDGKAKIYHADESQSKEVEEETTNWKSKLYQDIMNGVSHMLPFVVGGGILLALSFLVERFFSDTSPIYNLFSVGGKAAFGFLIPILAGYIAMSIGDRPALMPGMVAGFIAGQGAGFLGGLLGGFLAGYVILFLKKITRNLPKSLEGTKPMLIFPVFGLLLTSLGMIFVISPVFTVINKTINGFLANMGTTNSILLGALLGAMMSVDMGGPVNKASYTFSIGVFTDTGNGAFMAATMAGGMVAPLAIAIASSLFKNKFDEKEKKSAITNYILGASFITEGAIPFAAKDPLRVIVSSVIGSAIAGGLTQAFEIKSPAPHGGIFILPAMESVDKALFFVLSVAVGSLVSAIIYGLWKQKAE